MLSDILPKNVEEAKKYHFIQTPIIRLKWLEKLTGSRVFAKLENQQISGSFKYRGACFVMNNTKSKVIAASAGNHGLAIAKAAKHYNHDCAICIPANASQIKKDRIQREDIELIEFGQSLWEAEGYAKNLSERTGWIYISPYDNEFVVAGNSTIFLECQEQLPSVQNIIASVGGGGLLSGLIVGKNNAGSKINIIGAEPINYTTIKNNITDVAHTNFTTFADGLAVEVHSDSMTLSIIKEENPVIASVCEKDIAAATYSMLNHESILIEPSAGAAIAGFVQLAKNNQINGDTIIILSGGNVHKNVLNKILTYDFTGSALYEFLDLKGRKIEEIINSKNANHNSAKDPSLTNTDVIDKLKNKFEYLLLNIDNYILFCNSNELSYCADVIDRSISEIKFALSKLSTFDKRNLYANTQELRYFHSMYAFLNNSLEWRSPSYNQSSNPEFFNMGYQDSSGVNYERYSNPSSIELENKLFENFEIPSKNHTLLSVSSGMAAFSIIESYLLRFILEPEDKILLSPYIYFEAKEQLGYKYGHEIISSEEYSIECIIKNIQKYRPKVLFADPLANILEQRIIDIPKLLLEIDKVIDYPIYIVIDGTMLSGVLPRKLFNGNKYSKLINVLYYESGSKYLQLGMELTLFGLIVIPIELKAQMERLRRNHGAILSAVQADSIPVYSSKLFSQRMKKLSALSLKLAELLSKNVEFSKYMTVYHPMLESHWDHEIFQQANYDYLGSIVCLEFKNKGRNNINYLKAYVNSIISKAKHVSFPVCEGLSFGFTTTRISTASSMAESELPFMRISVGDLESSDIEKLAEIIVAGLAHLDEVELV